MCRTSKVALKINVSMTKPLLGSSSRIRALIRSWPEALCELSFFLMTVFIFPGLVNLIGCLLVGFTSGIKAGPMSLDRNVDSR